MSKETECGDNCTRDCQDGVCLNSQEMDWNNIIKEEIKESSKDFYDHEQVRKSGDKFLASKFGLERCVEEFVKFKGLKEDWEMFRFIWESWNNHKK